MSGALRRRSAASRKAAATRKRLLTFKDVGGPDAAHRGTERGDYTPSELIERIRQRDAQKAAE